jgi:uncharacterized membrane protein
MQDHDQGRSALERLTFFSDAVFAIAMTLLVIEVRVPHVGHTDEHALAQALLDLIPNYIGFLVSFIVVGRFWVGHHRVLGLLKSSNARLVWANLLFLLVVAFMPFPTAVFSEYVTTRVGVGLYAGWLTLLGLLNHHLIATALRDRRLVRDDVSDAICAANIRSSWIAVLIGIAALAAGMITPMLSLAALVLGSPLIGWLVRRGAPVE